jgi:hypothetical protein
MAIDAFTHNASLKFSRYENIEQSDTYLEEPEHEKL